MATTHQHPPPTICPALHVPVLLDYTNHKGTRRTRLVHLYRVWLGATEWHPEVQWLADGMDLEREGCPRRTFALAEVHGWHYPEGKAPEKQGVG